MLDVNLVLMRHKLFTWLSTTYLGTDDQGNSQGNEDERDRIVNQLKRIAIC